MKTKKLLPLMVGALCLAAFQTTAFAQERATKEEAKLMVDAAVAHVKKVGPEQAFKDFTVDKANWAKKDLYVFAYNMKGDCIANGGNDKFVGQNLIDLKDPTGKPIVKELIQTASSSGQGWVEYEWAHPQTKKVEAKASYVQKLANYEGLVGVGAYR
jgi:cytochrome c